MIRLIEALEGSNWVLDIVPSSSPLDAWPLSYSRIAVFSTEMFQLMGMLLMGIINVKK